MRKGGMHFPHNLHAFFILHPHGGAVYMSGLVTHAHPMNQISWAAACPLVGFNCLIGLFIHE